MTDKRRTLSQNAAFHARLSDWALKSGQHKDTLKRRVKDHIGQFTDVALPADPATDHLLDMLAKVFVALGKPDLMWVLPDRRSLRLYHTSAKWTKDTMRWAMDTVDIMAADEGITLTDPGNWKDAA